MLDDRKTAILSAVVQEYIATALPVGSTHIADAPGVRVSSATVRNEMAVLEQEGYLVQPHTSAGRIPTDKGYRFFVDHLATPGRIDAATRSQVGEFFRTAHGRLEEMLHRTSDLLADADQLRRRRRRPAGRAPSTSAACRSSGCRRRSATVVVVLGNGAVESEPIELADDVTRRPGRRGVGAPRGAARRVVAGGGRDSACRRATTTSTASAPTRCGAVRAASQRRARLRRRDVVDGVGVRRRRGRPRRAAHARAAVRRRVAGRRPRPARHVGGHRRRARRRAALGVLGRRRAGRSSTASSAARSACSARPG